MRFYSFIIIIFLIINRFAFSDFYFADTAKEFGTNEAIKSPIIEDEQELASKYSTDTNNINSFFQMQGTNIINQRGVTSSSIIFEPPYKSHPFRYTEVTFILSSFLSYTYASFLVFGLDALENTFVQPSTTGRARYKSLWISATIFEVTAGVIFGAAVAYDSYQRIFGKKKEGMSFNFVPYYEPINKDAGFMFSLSYPLTR
ncbi:hypothetical protein EPJ69_02290 [Brachyspira aalborgi]|mgnify:FL=1|jgi:hypothetical protein|uniref:Uncharacterized protein n=1 Tax=Brachyspira aalborgi TaxID=29522 RepID=A0A5C8G770_9SPIR|nr:hypothetical protein [Brachyspira aalborgi]TXJ12595.1 hypothetical protein EPJ80_03020 [Brachyspira aalborgi]TXJ16689.1 hypothetical protein EPJ77_02105 [Brachyspira aalborgi]TXJ22099.1 hypothetical protein EPJ64_02600 [Brachyspira aalborgi]TXJ26870.1 hypothetical protein EPJ73_03520 [Brachyspira aalborgi]TXJ34155.1 hypothetical protein EPJ69_02290 [Brachyspira aalborgi]